MQLIETAFEDFIGKYSKSKATLLSSGSATFGNETSGETTIDENQTNTTPIIVNNEDLQ